MGGGAAMAFSLIGGGASLYNAYSQSRAQQSQYRAYGSSLNRSAALSSLNAQSAMQAASINAALSAKAGGLKAAATRSMAAYTAQSHELDATIQINNAMLAEHDAADARKRMQYEVASIDMRNRRLAGAQRALYGGAGVTAEGTPSDVMFDSAMQGELEELAAMYVGESEIQRNLAVAYNRRMSAKMQQVNADAVRAFGNVEAGLAEWQGKADAASTMAMGNAQAAAYRMQASNSRYQAAQAQVAGRTAKQQGYVNMFASGLNAVSNTYNVWSNTKKTKS